MKTGKNISTLKPHDHLSLIYESEKEWEQAIVPFINSGLLNNEKCMYVVDDNDNGQFKYNICEKFRKSGIDLLKYERTGQFLIVDESDFYTTNGFFSPDKTIELFASTTEKALEEGYKALRCTSEMSWAIKGHRGAEKLEEYESILNTEIFSKYPCLVVCQYNRDLFDSKTLKEIVLTHPKLLRERRVLENLFYIPPEKYLKEDKADYELDLLLNTLEKESKMSSNNFRNIIENINDILIIISLDGIISYITPNCREKLGYSPEEVIGKSFVDFIHPGDRRKVRQKVISSIKKYYRTGENLDEETSIDFRAVHNNGKEIWLAIRNRIVQEENDSYLICIARNITSRKQMEDKIRYLSFHDGLTGLYNRAFMIEELKRLDVKRQFPLSIIILDVNGLKLVNDAYGHNTGDQLLVKTAGVLKKACRKEDIIARWGGDEFFILLPQTDINEAKKIIDRVNCECTNIYVGSVPLKVASGASTKENENENVNEILKEAEESMYRNKLAEGSIDRNFITVNLVDDLWKKTNETEEHTLNITNLGFEMGEVVGLSDMDLEKLSLLSLMHDIGKVIIPQDIIQKPGKLNNKEWDIVKKHCETGYQIARSSELLAPIAELILTHHERWDGKGYPRGLKENNIPLLARIFSILDAYDVMINGRPFQEPVTKKAALNELRRCSGVQFDPKLVDVFTKIIEDKYIDD